MAPSSPGHRLEGCLRLLGQAPQALAGSRSGGDYIGSYAAEWRHFVAAIRGETELLSTVSDGVAALRIVRAAVAAAESGRPVRLADLRPTEVSL